MKTKLLSFFTFLYICTGVNAQNVNIPDANFKAFLVGNTSINTSGDSEIQVSEASAYTGYIAASNQGIMDVTGIEAFTEIAGLHLFGNSNLTSIDVSQNTKIVQLLIENTSVSGLLDLSMLTALTDFKANDTAITDINMANGNNSNVTRFQVLNNASLNCIQIDTGFTPNGNWAISSSGSYSTSCATLSLDEFEIDSVSLYPNPTTSVLNIKMKSNLKQATVYSILGAKVLETTSKNILTSNLKNGLYLIKIEAENGTMFTKRFIKK